MRTGRLDRRGIGFFWTGLAVMLAATLAAGLGCGKKLAPVKAEKKGESERPPARNRDREFKDGDKSKDKDKDKDKDNEFRKLPNQGGGGGKGEGQAGEKKEERLSQVWHRDRRRPSFARVYVGDGNALELVSLHVTVTIQGPRARTLVDHIFRNPHDRQLEGTFEYPLPSSASPSYFAMFIGQTRETVPLHFGRRGNTPPLPESELAKLTPGQLVKQVNTADWGQLREGRVVVNDRALEAYEGVARSNIDPALLKYAGGNTFQGRVFPIPPRGYNRVLIAYEELLPATGKNVEYRFPLPDCKLTEMQFTLQVSAAEARSVVFRPTGARKEEGGGQVRFTRTWKDKGPGGDVRCAFEPPQALVQAVSGRDGDSGPIYLYARLRPDLKAKAAKPFAHHAVFLLDTSLGEAPDRFDVNLGLLRKILESDPDIEHFNVLTFDVAGRWLKPDGWLENTRAGRDRAFDLLDGIVLEGATDLSAALEKLVRPGFALPAGTPLNVFLLSDGQITWGETDVAALVARFEQRCPYATRFHCYRIGIGAENQELFEALTRRGGGVFTCHGKAELAAAARAHRNHCMRVEKVRFEGKAAVSEVLAAGRKTAVYPGGELVLAAQVSKAGPLQIVVEGTFLGEKVVQRFPVEVGTGGALAARGWGEIAVASLLALHDPRLDELVTAYCQQFGIASRVASFLVLENEDDYKRFNLQRERGKTLPDGDVGRFVEEAWRSIARGLTPREGWEVFLDRVAPRVGLRGGPGKHVIRLLERLDNPDCELPEGRLEGKILRKADVPAAYLEARVQDRERRPPDPYLDEARRRSDRQDVAGAVRALSCVVEEHPGRTDALRLVGYRLLDLKQPALAARLFRQVQQDRPFEPHSYRDLARALEECRKYGLAALQYEVVLAGTWHGRFGESLKAVVREEYARMLREALGDKRTDPAHARVFRQRLRDLAGHLSESDLRVTISWNTDATDVDLWVVEPDGTKCFYGNTQTPSGGELTQDQTQGYGPERYQIAKARSGAYQVLVHYFRPNPNLLGGETHVNVVITRHAGTKREVSKRRTVILKKADQQVLVGKVKF
jgi:hypothetical protein